MGPLIDFLLAALHKSWTSLVSIGIIIQTKMIKIKPYKEPYIRNNLHDLSFLIVCYLKRHAINNEPDLFKKAENALKTIIEKVDANLLEKQFFDSKEKVRFLKQLFFAISIYGINGREFFLKFCTLPIAPIKKIADSIFEESLFNDIETIQFFSHRYSDFDAFSLIDFDDIDLYIDKLIKLESEYEKIEKNQEGVHIDNEIYPTCYHKSLLDSFEFEQSLSHIDTTKPLTIEVDPRDTNFDIEQFLFKTIKRIRVYQSNIPDWVRRFEVHCEENKCLDDFVIRYLRPNRPKIRNVMTRFIGLKIWDIKYQNKTTIPKSIESCKEWFEDKYPKKQKLKKSTYERYYKITQKCIKHKQYI